MLYRKLGNTGLEVSEVSLGCEYVWFSSEEEVKAVVDTALEAGINYIDIFVGTASTRENFGKALRGRRDRVYLAAHLGAADKDGQYVRTRDEAVCRKFIGEFYEKLETDYVDVLFLHNCDDMQDFEGIMNGWMYAYAKELKDAGKARLIGFSSHNTKIAMEAVKTGKIDVLMFPVNPLFNMLPQDTADARMRGLTLAQLTQEEKDTYPDKQQLYSLCKERGVGLIAMKPFAGGNILKAHEEGRLKGILELTPVQAISYVLSFPEVACPVPGFANVRELQEGLAYFTATEEEKDLSSIRKSLLGQFSGQCMYCNHCQPCPVKIDIAEVTKLADMAEKGMPDALKARYAALPVKADACLACGACTKRCPFDIDAAANIARAAKLFHE